MIGHASPKFLCYLLEEIKRINIDYYRQVSIIVDYCYLLLLTATMAALVTKVLLNVRRFSRKVPAIFALLIFTKIIKILEQVMEIKNT